MRDPAIGSIGGGWRPAVRFRGATLLNDRWHRPRWGADTPRCPVCDVALTEGDHAVHQDGEILHPNCMLYRW